MLGNALIILCGKLQFRYERAEKHFEEALKLVRSIDDSIAEKWEPLLNNLGHVSRKRGKFFEALDYHQQVRKICLSGFCLSLLSFF